MQARIITLRRFQRLRIASFWIVGSLLAGFVLFTHSGWEWYHPLGIDVEELIELTGLGLIGIAVLGRLWCTLYIGGRKSSELVQMGPYSVSRNPLYLFSTIGAAGVGAQTGSMITMMICAFLAASILHVTIRREELHLRERFGDRFDEYRKRVPAFFPRASLFRDPETLEIVPRRLYGTLRDGLVFFLAMPLFEFAEHLQDIGILPVLFRIY